MPCNSCRHIEETDRKLMDMMEQEKANLILTSLRTCNRGMLDRMRDTDPELIDWIVEHYNERKTKRDSEAQS